MLTYEKLQELLHDGKTVIQYKGFGLPMIYHKGMLSETAKSLRENPSLRKWMKGLEDEGDPVEDGDSDPV